MDNLRFYEMEGGVYVFKIAKGMRTVLLLSAVLCVLIAFFVLHKGQNGGKFGLLFVAVLCLLGYLNRSKGRFSIDKTNKRVTFKSAVWSPELTFPFEAFSRFYVHKVSYFGFIPINATGTIYFMKDNGKETGFLLRMTAGATKSIQRAIDETAGLMELPEDQY